MAAGEAEPSGGTAEIAEMMRELLAHGALALVVDLDGRMIASSPAFAEKMMSAGGDRTQPIGDALRACDAEGRPALVPSCRMLRACAHGRASRMAIMIGGASYQALAIPLSLRGTPCAAVVTCAVPGAIGHAPLTPRERDVLRLLGEGSSTRDIAVRLGIKEVTARNHVTALLKKLGARRRLEAVAIARRAGLV